jgi:hypothetical protein
VADRISRVENTFVGERACFIIFGGTHPSRKIESEVKLASHRKLTYSVTSQLDTMAI